MQAFNLLLLYIAKCINVDFLINSFMCVWIDENFNKIKKNKFWVISRGGFHSLNLNPRLKRVFP